MPGKFALKSFSGCALVAAALLPVSPARAEVPLPTGSYLSSCKVVSFDASTGALSAECGGENVSIFQSRPGTSNFNVIGCKEGSIWNDNRQLYCYAASEWGNDRVIPPGSYIASCTDRKVVGGALLTAVCDNGNGVSQNASLDLRTCKWGGDVWNMGARLGCTSSAASAGAIAAQAMPVSPFASSPGVVKPVLVEPGVVKPVLIAPLAPADPAATEEESDGKKKKRRRGERGERG